MSTKTITGTTEAPFNWDELIPDVAAPAPTSQVGANFKVEDVPAPLRQRIEQSLALSVTKIEEAIKAGTKRESVPPQWRLQAMPNQAMADEAVKLMRKYGQRRPEKDIPFYAPGTPVGQITVRVAPVLYGTDEQVAADAKRDAKNRTGVRKAPKDVKPGLYLRYAAKPLEGKKSGG